MTELETLQRAKMYMEKLANGINPIDGSMIPDDDVVNNVRLSRCFFYVADVLRQVIDSGGVAPQKKPKKEPFALTTEQRSAFQFSGAPIPISELSKRISFLSGNENMATLSYAVIRDWLMSIGMLEEVPDGNGKYVKHPTEQGKSIGISLDPRTGRNGEYFVVVYNISAQHFILDNLDAVIEFGNTKKDNQGHPWSLEHDRCMRDLHQKGVPISEIAITLKRNPSAVHQRLKKLGLIE